MSLPRRFSVDDPEIEGACLIYCAMAGAHYGPKGQFVRWFCDGHACGEFVCRRQADLAHEEILALGYDAWLGPRPPKTG